METAAREKLALFAFSFVLLAAGGPCGMMDQYFTIHPGNATPAMLSASNETTAHYVCENLFCMSSPGPGADECSSDYDCKAPAPATHMACMSAGCTVVAGPGKSDCTFDSDCPAYVEPPPAPAPSGCQQYTDCSSCLKTAPGECKWCIQGSVCADSGDNSQPCTFGPTADKWLTIDYQCSLATR